MTLLKDVLAKHEELNRIHEALKKMKEDLSTVYDTSDYKNDTISDFVNAMLYNSEDERCLKALDNLEIVAKVNDIELKDIDLGVHFEGTVNVKISFIFESSMYNDDLTKYKASLVITTNESGEVDYIGFDYKEVFN